MRSRRLTLASLALSLTLGLVCASICVAQSRPRLAILTDIGGDPDDQQSMIRLMLYANQFDIELLMATAAGTRGELKEAVTRRDLIVDIVQRYGQVVDRLKRHESGWPTAEQLLSKVVSGNRQRGRDWIGEAHDTEGSRALIKLIDSGSSENRLNISIWGGQTDLAQALWRVKYDRGLDGLSAFVNKLRVYDINDQDGIAGWIHDEFPGMYYILATAPKGQDKRLGTYRGMYLTGDESLTSPAWINEHIRAHGPLGEIYPMKTWTAPNPHSCLKEGDTPSWFFFLPKGGNQCDDPMQPGWGGRYQKGSDGWYHDLASTADFDPRTTVSQWRAAYQSDFATRMAWCD